jgi:hypothetical protein
MSDTIVPRTRPCFPFGPFLECLRVVHSLSTRVPSAKVSMRQMMRAFCGFWGWRLQLIPSPSKLYEWHLPLPLSQRPNRPDGRLHENVWERELVWQAVALKKGCAIHKSLWDLLFQKCGHQFLLKMEFTGEIWPPSSTDIRKYFSSPKSSP